MRVREITTRTARSGGSVKLPPGGVRPIRLPTSPDFGLPKGRTTIKAAECELPSHWNRNPIATPEHRSRDSRKAVLVSLSATNRVPMPKATRAQHQPHFGPSIDRDIDRNSQGTDARKRHG